MVMVDLSLVYLNALAHDAGNGFATRVLVAGWDKSRGDSGSTNGEKPLVAKLTDRADGKLGQAANQPTNRGE